MSNSYKYIMKINRTVQNINLNNVVTPFFSYYTDIHLIGETRETWDPKLKTKVSTFEVSLDEDPMGFKSYVQILISESAYKILAVSDYKNYKKEIEDKLSKYPDSIKRKIEFVDKNQKIWERVKNYMEPILYGDYNEVKMSEFKVKDRIIGDAGLRRYFMSTSQVDVSKKSIQYSQNKSDLHILTYFLYNFVLGCKYKAEVDGDINPVLNSIMGLRKRMKDEEAQIRLDQLNGIFKLYNNLEKVDTFKIHNKYSGPSLIDRLEELLDDAELIELSKRRHLIGIPEKIQKARILIKRKVREISNDRKKMQILSNTKQLLQLIELNQSISLPKLEIRKLSPDVYVPPIVNLDKYIPTHSQMKVFNVDTHLPSLNLQS